MLSTDGFYIATCWGTSSFDGNGTGYFTPLSAIHSVYEDNAYDWLLDVPLPFLARRIPIRDWDRPNHPYREDFIPLPGVNRILVP